MKYLTISIIVTWLLGTQVALYAAEEAKPSQAPTIAIRENMGALIDLIESSKVSAQSENKNNILATLQEYSVGNLPEPPLTSQLLYSLARLSRDSEHETTPARYIRHDFIVEILVMALFSSDDYAQARAIELIWDYVKPQDLAKWPQVLIEAAQHIRDYKLAYILGQLSDMPLVRQYFEDRIKSGITFRDEILARLGDRKIEANLIQQFEKGQDIDKMSELAFKLGYVSSQDSILALIQQLRNPQTEEGWSTRRHYSLRYEILRSLGRVFPGETLFTDELIRVVQETQYLYDPKAAEKASNGYFDRVEEWCREKYGVSWPQPRPPFLLYRINIVPDFFE